METATEENKYEELMQRLDAIALSIEKQGAFNQDVMTRLDIALSRSESVGLAVREIAATANRMTRMEQRKKKKWYQFWK